MRHSGHPCASLPFTQLSLCAWYCHVHQAWFYTAQIARQTGEDAIEALWSEHLELGPFDDEEALYEAFNRLLAAHRTGHG